MVLCERLLPSATCHVCVLRLMLRLHGGNVVRLHLLYRIDGQEAKHEAARACAARDEALARAAQAETAMERLQCRLDEVTSDLVRGNLSRVATGDGAFPC